MNGSKAFAYVEEDDEESGRITSDEADDEEVHNTYILDLYFVGYKISFVYR